MADQQETLKKYHEAIEACEKIADRLVGPDNGFVCAFLPGKDQDAIPYLVSNAPSNHDIQWVLEQLLEAVKDGRMYDPRLATRES